MADLPTPFRPGGRVTAATSSPLTDGATAALLVAEEKAAEWGVAPRARLVSYAYAGVPAEVMGLGPIPATEKALAKAGLSMDDIGLIEINEAFAVQVLSFLDAFGIAGIVVRDAEGVEEGEHLHGERLVDLDEADVVHAEPGLRERLLRRRDRAEPHYLSGDACVGVGHEPGARGDAPLRRLLLGNEQGRRGTVGERGRRRRRDPPAGAEGGRQIGHSFDRGARAGWFVRGRQAPAPFGVGDADRNEVGRDESGRERLGVLALALRGKGIGPLTSEGGVLIVEVLGRRAHVEGVRSDDALGEIGRASCRGRVLLWEGDVTVEGKWRDSRRETSQR